jgi:16S rRNA pseudouridine516 synthase
MFAAAGLRVEYLKRLQIGGVALDGALAPGQYRELTADEARKLGQCGNYA